MTFGSDILTRVDPQSAVAVLAPRGRDGAVAERLLTDAGIAVIVTTTIDALVDLIHAQIAAVLVTEEALDADKTDTLKDALSLQPTWSDIPFVVLSNGGTHHRTDNAMQRMDALQNAVLLSRPLHADELIRSVRSALTARERQHHARRLLEELQLRQRQLEESEAKFHAIADSVDQMIWTTLPDGFHDYYNQRWYQFTGVPEGSTDGEAWNDMFHPDDQDRAWGTWRHSLQTGESYEIEYRLKHHSGGYRWVLGRAQPLRDATGQIQRWYGSCTDIHDIKLAQEQRQLLLAEMNHRVKNTLAMVHAMVSQTLRQSDNLIDARASIQSRISMMAQAHDRLVHTTWTETRIMDVTNAALIPHRMNDDRFTIDGPDLPIGSKQALALTMALHELATNATKYGSLSQVDGQVRITWYTDNTPLEPNFNFVWQETGGPAVEKPMRRGFGSRMIEQALAGYFSGNVELDYDRSGLCFKLIAPLMGLQA
ncbi:HWE histidine kinase domain-containing protein [Loktanella sp. SALINAS62]|uniref:sensor histidine kinase n=1 Tax=Loktanella sp. SALINAS62 TaxID=2706124 RepID=UPI001B8C4527|nr:HWE histidine kinase domain-containing protein [Loktanella sp. SALINAS62]MBS1300952.1 PAS domain-containing protein [Loktanella sp. SALINAS62]